VTVACSSESLARLIDKGSASYVLHVECGNTLYREAFDFAEQNKRIDIPANKVNGTTEINCFVRATKDLEKYRVDGAHDDYGSTTFQVRTGDILAVGEGQTFEAESQDTLRRIGSIMVIEESARSDEHPMEVQFANNRIRIMLCKPDFARYRELKSIPVLASHLTTTIVLPVLTESLHLIQEGTAELEDLRWYRNLETRMNDLGLRDQDELLTTAQILLDMPIRRAFASAAQYAAER
jgi:hypothetical protein